ncbi:MAG TPA: transcriptional repressor NrdR, partial [Gammaproteobacteria bacterium]|nr:transcriptional repressor NrdR [Gammaproteobacteria bacterium]
MTTIETVCHTLPRVIKQTGERETFSEEKLRTGVIRALDKRAVAADDVEAMFAAIMSELSRMGEREIPSARLGDMVMDKLKLLDPVAYVRFAS